MNEQTDAQLLRAFADRGDEAAFHELVARHTSFVYFTALRQVESSAIAADLAQMVFADLARKAPTLAGKIGVESSLIGWLHRATRFAALNYLRDDRRRRDHERRAMEQLITDYEPSADWDQIRPLLDEALDQLADNDREVLLLRYFKNQDFRAVGLALGISDDAAQKRVSRAIEELREFFSKRKITISAAGLVALISATAVQAAPTGLAAAISSAALIGATVQTSTAVAATKAVAMATIKKTLITSALTVLVGAGIYEARQAARVREQNQALQQAQALLTAQNQQMQRERDAATNRSAGLLAENSQLKSNSNESELLKLRGKLGLLRQQITESKQMKGPTDTDSTKTNQLRFLGYATPESTFQSMVWAVVNGDYTTWKNSFSEDEIQRNPNDLTEISFQKQKLEPGFQGVQVLAKKTLDDGGSELKVLFDKMDGSTILVIPFSYVGGEYKVNGEFQAYQTDWDKAAAIQKLAN